MSLPALRVVDAPRFGYRGFMLDVARNFQPKAAVLRVLDLMARYKLNVFHFHLTDDEGWRLEIPSLPELTSVGARRGHTLDSSRFLPPAYGSGPDVDRPYGSGFFSRADYVEILKYAAARHIEVIPELEMPGHARAAIKAMEARFRALQAKGDAEGAGRFRLSDPEDRSTYTSAQLYHDNVMNPALPSTYAFVERVVQDLVALHREAGVPLRNLHMGGDEVPGGVWQGSPAVQAYLKEHGLGSVDELWYVFYGRVAEILKPHGIPLSGWEEIGLRTTRLDGRPKMIPNPDFAARGWRAYVWNNVPGSGAEDLAYRLANGGYKVVLCPVTQPLLRPRLEPEPGGDGARLGRLRRPQEAVRVHPVRLLPQRATRPPRQPRRPRRLRREGPPHRLRPVERPRDPGQPVVRDAERRGAPRLQARAEALRPRRAGVGPGPGLGAREGRGEVRGALPRRVVRVRQRPRQGGAAAARPRGPRPGTTGSPTPGLSVVDGQVRCSLEIPGFVLRYTTDGSEPTAKSPEVRGGIPLARDVRVAAFDATGRKGHTARLTTP